VVRLLPPLIVEEEHVRDAVHILSETAAAYPNASVAA
jgi:acetylornithine/succinyldiaminopimelate/putrescine aminotransferase